LKLFWYKILLHPFAICWRELCRILAIGDFLGGDTKDLMHRKSWEIEDGTECVLCDSHTAETRDHLFFEYAKKCWEIVNIVWDCSHPMSTRFLHAQGNISGHCFTGIFVCAVWNIWNDCNNQIFDA
jgi:hypothetical protein